MPPRLPESTSKRSTRASAPRAHKLVLHVTLRHIHPTIWRRVAVPDHLTLYQLHRVLQLVFGWQDYHLHAFELDTRRFTAPEDEFGDERTTRTTLRSLGLGTGSRLVYRYDYGDSWKHELLVEKSTPLAAGAANEAWPELLGGARAAPPEDCGGPPGYEGLLTALGDPHHPDHEELRAWVGPDYDPERFDAWMVRGSLTLAVAWGAI